MTPVIRDATHDDAALVARFIRELARYEQLEHEVVGTVDDIARTLFGQYPAAEVVIAEIDGTPVGFALFFPTYSTFLSRAGMHLEDLYVTPAARGQGVGRALLAHLAALSVARGYGRLEWAVLDWNEPAIGFYRELGAAPLDEWTTWRLTDAPLHALAQRATRSR